MKPLTAPRATLGLPLLTMIVGVVGIVASVQTDSLQSKWTHQAPSIAPIVLTFSLSTFVALLNYPTVTKSSLVVLRLSVTCVLVAYFGVRPQGHVVVFSDNEDIRAIVNVCTSAVFLSAVILPLVITIQQLARSGDGDARALVPLLLLGVVLSTVGFIPGEGRSIGSPFVGLAVTVSLEPLAHVKLEQRRWLTWWLVIGALLVIVVASTSHSSSQLLTSSIAGVFAACAIAAAARASRRGIPPAEIEHAKRSDATSE